MKKDWLLLLMVIIIVILVTALSMISIFKDNSKYKYTLYQIDIIADESTNYTVYVPVPLNPDGSISPLYENLKCINGECNYSLIDTNYGKAIQIIGSGDIEIMSILELTSSEYEQNRYSNLSMWFDSNFEFGSIRLYSNISNPASAISVRLTHDHSTANGAICADTIKAILKSGWRDAEINRMIAAVPLE
jgi:hypothetical protein